MSIQEGPFTFLPTKNSSRLYKGRVKNQQKKLRLRGDPEKFLSLEVIAEMPNDLDFLQMILKGLDKIKTWPEQN